MAIERRHNTANLFVSFKDVFTSMEIDGIHSLERVPGSWDPFIEIKTRETSRRVSEVTFFIRPLINGVQDFGLCEEPTKDDS